MNNLDFSKLRAQGYRLTPQRLIILRILGEAGCHLSALEVCKRAQELMPGMTEATVYRTLSFMVDQGLLLAAHVGNGQLVYEIANRDHHHLVCRKCGNTFEIDHAMLKELYQQLEERSGYRIDSVHVTFFGVCPNCQ